MDDRLTRRTFVCGVSTAVATGLAGCSEDQSGGGAGTPTRTGGTDSMATEPANGGDTDTTEAETGAYRNGVGQNASVSVAVPNDTAALTSPSVQWRATADGVTIEEAGEVTSGAGHYHIIVDADPVTPGETIPTDDAHIHYGTGQKDGVLELDPGEHTLHLQLGDGAHTAMALTDSVDVTVSDEASLSVETSVDGSVVDWEASVENYTIGPTSDGITSNTGHLHAIVNTDPVPTGEVIPNDARHVHYGDGSTSGSLDLAEQLGDAYEAGEHTVHFQIASATHRATTLTASETVTTE
ncbi:DUF4399 domain-containing protein [Haloarcula hispanica]|uniref:DUF4399 domain-containing protein n=1 Tax=Haloarcula hispanica TaxID=51589 RepID=A0A482T2A2_HALHI|nr:DUF4399 domain-containing protein [Haloarcula hispanica]MCJ0620045.1 DUF4399 domain-containing protein [Haloarcula hispanica]RYJ10484.1 DUF4399 domain-containing protein [Haloarcula hispanica]